MQATLTVKEGTVDTVMKALEPTGCKCVNHNNVQITVSGNPVQVRNAARVTGVLRSAAIPEAPAAPVEPTHGTQAPAAPATSETVPPAAPAADNAPAASEGTPDATPEASADTSENAEGPNSPDEVVGSGPNVPADAE